MEANQNLYYKLRDGYRMEKPAYANRDIYDIMLSCWATKPESRPLFNELERTLGSFLHESVKDVRSFFCILLKSLFKLATFAALSRSQRAVHDRQREQLSDGPT